MKPEDLDDHTPIEPDNELLTRVHSRSASFRRRRTIQRMGSALIVVVVVALAGGIAWSRVGSTDTHVSSPGTSAPGLTADTIIGSWHPASIAGYDGPLAKPPLAYAPLLQFERGGKWRGSDGCNDVAGTYTLGADGAFSLTQHLSTLVNCLDKTPTPESLAEATHVRVGNDRLTFVDHDGHELAEFARDVPPVPTTACTNNDLSRTGTVAMPAPVRLAQSRVYDHGNIHLDPPPAGASPSASPSEIWQGARAFESPVGTYELVLADYSSLTPSTGGVPEFQHVLAWVVIGHHVPGVSSGGGLPLPGVTTVPQPPCQFVTVVDAYNAQTGKGMVLTEGDVGASTTASRTGELLGWHTMAYLGSNRASAPIELRTQAAAGVVAGAPTTVVINPFPVGSPVWSSITPARFSVDASLGTGRIEVSTAGCPATGPCDAGPLYTSIATPIPSAPPGGIVTRLGFSLSLDTTSIEPGRYDLTLPIRYPSSDKHPTVLDTTDTLHLRIDVTRTAPPPSVCTSADLHLGSTVIPAGHVLDDTITIEGGDTRLDPPPRGFRPRVSAAHAREEFSNMRASLGGGGDATLVLASVSEVFARSVHPDGTSTPDTHDVVAWVLYTQRVAVTPPVPPPGATFGEVTTRPQAPCTFLDGFSAINATSGAQMDSGGFSSAAVPIHF